MIARPETMSFNRAGWTWNLKDSSVLDPWLEDFLDGNREGVFRVNAGKDVFRVVSYERPLLIRSYHPKRALAKLKSRVSPKAKDEYESSLLLEDAGLPVIDCLGWGRRGPDSICVFMESQNTMGAREFWLSNVPPGDSPIRQTYLVALSRFLASLLASGVVHDELRLGRLLVAGTPFGFLVGEPHGFEKPASPDPLATRKMMRIVGELRGEINTGEAAAMFMYAKAETDAEKAAKLWREVLADETASVEENWPKRKKRILSGDPRYSSLADSLLLRCGFDSASSLIANGGKPEALAKFDRIDFRSSPEEALRLWLLSFKLMFHRLRHRMPAALELDAEKKPLAIYFERRDGFVSGGHPSIQEFIDKCLLAGIKREELESNLDVIDGRIEIADISRLSLEV